MPHSNKKQAPKRPKPSRNKGSRHPVNVPDRQSNKTYENLIDVDVTINPYHLSQFIFGYVSSCMTVSDYVGEVNNINSITNYFLYWFPDPLGSGLDKWPKTLLEVASQLRQRRVRKWNFTPDWSQVKIFAMEFEVQGAAYLQTNGISSTSNDTAAPNPLGYYPINSPPLNSNDPDNVREWMERYAAHTRPYSVALLDKLDDKSGSAFAFSAQGTPPAVGSTFVANDLVFWSGRATNNAPLYSHVLSTSSSEVQITKRWLASLRLGTPSPDYESTPTTPTVPYIPPVRFPSVCIPTYSAPGTIGHAKFCKYKSDVIQLKQVPSVSLMQSIINRYEYVGRKIGEAWTSALGQNDLVAIAYMLVRRFMARYSGSATGVFRVTSPVSISQLDPLHTHIGDSIIDINRLPAPVSDVLGALSAISQPDGVLIPCIASLGLTATSVYLTYTGESVLPTLPALSVMRNYFAWSNFATKLKPLEFVFAPYTVMRSVPDYGKSYLDCTLVLDSVSATNVMAVVSRRKLDATYLEIMKRAGGITYTLGTGGDLTSTVFKYMVGSYAKRFNQRYTKYLSDQYSISTYETYASQDGWIPPGTMSTNVPGNDPLPIVAPKENLMTPYERVAHFIKSKATDLGLKWGNYCGYDWTAGERGGKPPMRNGQYLAEPLSLEDAACKKHDEAYFHAKGDPSKMQVADYEFARALGKIDAKGELSIGGKLAYVYFSQPKDEL